MGLAYKDGTDDEVLMLIREGKLVRPHDGWSREDRIYIPQEPISEPVSKPKGKIYIHFLAFRYCMYEG